jgi:hypothetical protein
MQKISVNNAGFRKKLIEIFQRNIDFHERGKFDQLDGDFDALDALREMAFDADLTLAWNFWEGWCDEARHGFKGLYKGISKNDWPQLAEGVVECLATNKPIENKLIQNQFDFKKR